jgi:restriction system protein
MTKTIIQAIKEVMQAERKPMTAAEVYDAIVSADLYTFNADKPVHVVQTQIRRHAKGLDFPSASNIKYFEIFQNGKYCLLHQGSGDTSQTTVQTRPSARRGTLNSIKKLHNQYSDEFKSRALREIKKLDPISFEQFCRNLLAVYGFRDVTVTRPAKDGGIDGHGRLEVGVTYLRVAFQCKRWTKRKNVGRPEVDQFRGATQGQYEQGYFFTTADFSPEAKKNSFKPGAVPIILIDGMSIIDIMINKQFGVETEQLPVHTLALDLALSEED